MDTASLIGSLALVTLALGLAIAVFMLVRARRSQRKRGEVAGDEDLLAARSKRSQEMWGQPESAKERPDPPR